MVVMSRILPIDDRPVLRTRPITNDPLRIRSTDVIFRQLKEDVVRKANPKMTSTDEVAERTNGKRSQKRVEYFSSLHLRLRPAATQSLADALVKQRNIPL